jgi:hypothetical protein
MLPTSEKHIKHNGVDGERPGDEMFARAPGRRRSLATAFGIVALLYLAWTSISKPGGIFHQFCNGDQAEIQPPKELSPMKALVPLEAHIMSKCPDATVGFTCKLRMQY